MLRDWGKKKSAEKEARDASRKTIQDTMEQGKHHGKVLEELSDKFYKHIDDEETSIKDIFKKMSELKCPKEETIQLLEGHNDKQSSHLRKLSEQGKETSRKLDDIISQTKGADKEKEKEERKKEQRLNNRRFYIALVTCMFLGISTLIGMLIWFKGDTTENTTLESRVIELEKHEQ